MIGRAAVLVPEGSNSDVALLSRLQAIMASARATPAATTRSGSKRRNSSTIAAPAAATPNNCRHQASGVGWLAASAESSGPVNV